MKTPRSGSTAKVWTDVSTPDRTRKVPSSDSEKAKMARRIVQTFSALRFSTTMEVWSRAMATSQGMNEAFSTGSQNQKPPQPSS
jgi:hypothetical protein